MVEATNACSASNYRAASRQRLWRRHFVAAQAARMVQNMLQTVSKGGVVKIAQEVPRLRVRLLQRLGPRSR